MKVFGEISHAICLFLFFLSSQVVLRERLGPVGYPLNTPNPKLVDRKDMVSLTLNFHLDKERFRKS